ncbi:MAG TPA: hypothetical protein VI110_04260 [Lapillicoccus sp.]
MLDWTTVLAAVGEAQTGDRSAGRDGLLACWARTSPADHAYRCVLAHYLADLQDSLDDEVAWDQVALEESAHLHGAALTAVGIPDVAGLAPTLHLNLGDGYLRQGRVGEAAEQLRQGQAAVGVLSDDGYGRMIRDGLTRLEARVAQAAERPMTSGVDPGL